MAELERTVVQLWEAKRLSAKGDVPHGRLALLLLDNAAEVSLSRTAQSKLQHAEMYNTMAYIMRGVAQDDQEGQRLKAKLDAQTVSKRQRKQIERTFDALVDYVFGQDDCQKNLETA